MSDSAEIGYFSPEGSITLDLGKEINANFFDKEIRTHNKDNRGLFFSPSLFSVGSSTGSTWIISKTQCLLLNTYCGWNGRAPQKLMHCYWLQLIFAQENVHLKRNVSICFLGSSLHLEIWNEQSGCPATTYHLTQCFPTILLMDTGTPSIDCKSSTLWTKFSDTSLGIFHVCSHCTHHMGPGCSDDLLFPLWSIILHWDLSQRSLYCRTARWLRVKDLPLSFSVSVSTGLKWGAQLQAKFDVTKKPD